MSRILRLFGRLLAILAGAIVFSGCRGPARSPGTAGDGFAPPSEYSLYEIGSRWRDQHGDTIRLAALAGRPRLVAMVYTGCHTSCPLLVADMKRIEARLSATERAKLGYVLVSLDPAHDTPGRLQEWGEHAGLEPVRWTLLAGDDDAVRELAAALEVRYQVQPNGEVAHTNVLTLLDAAGAVVHRQIGLGGADETLAAIARLTR